MNFSNKVYDTLKWIAQILLPALGTLYFAMAGIWGFPYGEQIIGTISAVDVFLGVILGLSSATYSKGYRMFKVPVDALKDVGTVTFTVNPEDLPSDKEVNE